jgi:hypothetical protein
MRTAVYVDGFNLYFGVLKRTPYKWLDLQRLFESVLTRNRITISCVGGVPAFFTHPGNDNPQARKVVRWR